VVCDPAAVTAQRSLAELADTAAAADGNVTKVMLPYINVAPLQMSHSQQVFQLI